MLFVQCTTKISLSNKRQKGVRLLFKDFNQCLSSGDTFWAWTFKKKRQGTSVTILELKPFFLIYISEETNKWGSSRWVHLPAERSWSTHAVCPCKVQDRQSPRSSEVYVCPLAWTPVRSFLMISFTETQANTMIITTQKHFKLTQFYKRKKKKIIPQSIKSKAL